MKSNALCGEKIQVLVVYNGKWKIIKLVGSKLSLQNVAQVMWGFAYSRIGGLSWKGCVCKKIMLNFWCIITKANELLY